MPVQFQSFSVPTISRPSLPVFVSKVGRRNTTSSRGRNLIVRSWLHGTPDSHRPPLNRPRYSPPFPLLRIERKRIGPSFVSAHGCTENLEKPVGLKREERERERGGWMARRRARWTGREVAEVGHHVNCIPDCGLLKSGALHWAATPPLQTVPTPNWI